MADERNQVPSFPPPADAARLREWLEQVWRALRDMEAKQNEHEERIEELEDAP